MTDAKLLRSGSWCYIGGRAYVRPNHFRSQYHGRPSVYPWLRVPVSVIVGQIAHGASFEEILEGYPDLEREDIQQAIEYAAWLAQEQVQTS